ncbi:MAG: alpha/beta hydrolase [Ignavibacteria bacterium]|nr:alpha/beta hydrolase [Ignavibacteria bacterium]
MKRTFLLLVLSSLFLFGCSLSVDIGLKKYSIINPQSDTLILYVGKREDSEPSNKLLVMIQGSGRESIQRRFGWGGEGATLGYDILYMEKFSFDDSLKFQLTDCRERRINDIEFTLNYVQDSIYSNKLSEMLIFADSEGGAVSPSIANRNHLIKRMIIIGNGGLSGTEKINLVFEKEKRTNKKGYFLLSGIDTNEKLDSLLLEIKNNPTTEKQFLGFTYKYWNSYIFYDIDSEYDKLKIPTLVIVGENDMSIPVESVLSLKERYKNRNNFSFHVIPDVDHFFIDFEGNKKFPEVYRNIIIPWFKLTEMQ